jgi:hypothetical protein
MGRWGQPQHRVRTQHKPIKVDRVRETSPPEQDWDTPMGFNARQFEYEPNPVIFSHLRRSSFPKPTHIDSGRQEQIETWFNPDERQPQISPIDLYTEYEGTLHSSSNSRAQNNTAPDIYPVEGSLHFPASTFGPASSVPLLSVYACPQCPETFRKAYQRK